MYLIIGSYPDMIGIISGLEQQLKSKNKNHTNDLDVTEITDNGSGNVLSNYFDCTW